MVKLHFDATSRPPVSTISLTFGKSKSEFRWTDRRSMTFDEFGALLSQDAIGQKDGTCYTPATFAGNARRMDQAVRIDIVVLDADCGHTLDEIRNALLAKKWRGIVHSTYSHLSDTTVIAAEAADKWMAENGTDDIGAYMLSKKGYLPRILKGARIADETLDGRSRSYIVKHQPCPKFRIILPLQDPWIADDYESQSVANASWRERIGALAHALGLHHDQSCVDTSRLFYFPRHQAGAEFIFLPTEGDECPLWALPDVPATPAAMPLLEAAQGAAKPTLVPADHMIYRANDGTWINLSEWAAGKANEFEIVKAIRTRAPHMLGSRRTGVKQHILCPHNDAHVTGGNDTTGTFIVNASQVKDAGLPSITSGFVIHCVHNGCAGRDRLAFVHKMLCDGILSIPDLTDPEFLIDPLPRVDFTALKTPKKIDTFAALYADLPGVMHDMHHYICATSAKPQPALNLGAVLAFMGAAIGRKVKLQNWGLRPNVYILGVAHSGSGKERALSACKEMAQAAGLFEKLIGVEEVASDAGIISSVMEQPAQVMLLDEVSSLISAVNSQKAGSHMAGVISTLLKLYSSSHTRFKSKSYADSSKVQSVDQPCVSLYGCSTPRGLFSALTSKDIHSGLLSRAVLFDAGDNDPRRTPPQQMPVPQSIIDWLQAWDAMPLNNNPLNYAGGNPVIDPVVVMMTQDAMDLSEAFEDEMHIAKVAARARGMDALYVRAGENALKFALIRACAPPAVSGAKGPAIDKSTLRVDAGIMAWAISLSRSTIENMDKASRDQISDSLFETKVKLFRDMVKQAGQRGITLREMGRQSAGRLPDRERQDIIRLLRETSDIYFVENVNAGKRGVKRAAYVHGSFIQEPPQED